MFTAVQLQYVTWECMFTAVQYVTWEGVFVCFFKLQYSYNM